MDDLKKSVLEVLKNGSPVAVIGLIAVAAIGAIWDLSK